MPIESSSGDFARMMGMGQLSPPKEEPHTVSTHNILTAYLRDHEITHFTGMEVAKLALPPRILWANIVPTLLVLERLRARLNGIQPGAYIIVTSGYRTYEHNARVGGAPNSQHIKFRAIDFVPMRGTNPIPLGEVWNMLWEHEPLVRYLGMGRYETFLHVDCRGLFDLTTDGAFFRSGVAD